MEELFFEKSNFEMIYSLIDDDIHERFKISIDDLSINAREILYESMVDVFSEYDNCSLQELNKNLLINCIPIISSNIPDYKKITDDISNNNIEKKFDEKDVGNSLQTAKQNFKLESNSESNLNSNLDSPNIHSNFSSISTLNSNQNLNLKTQDFLNDDIDNRIVSVDIPKKTIIIQKELDINSGDRNNWLLDKTDSPYDFVVNLGASNTFNGISTPYIFKNVVAINLTHIIIPSIGRTLSQYPFLYLQIDEISSVYESTSENGRRSFVKLLRDKHWTESDASNIVYYTFNTRGTGAFASQGWKSDTPIGSLNQMSIKILTSNGYPLNKNKDVYEIDDITETNDELIVTTTEIIHNNYIHSGNRIGFKHLITDNDNLNNFLESNEHIITNITNNTNIHFKKNIESYNSTTNIYTNYNLNTNNINISQGCVMNLSLQTTFGFKINSKIHALNNEIEII